MTTTNPPVHHRTWKSEHMSGYRHSTATSPGGLTTSQDEMKRKLLQEFDGATFTVDMTARGATLPADQNDVEKVLDYLRDTYGFTHVTLFGSGNSTEDAPRLPSNGFTSEKMSYEPLTHILNIIVRAANSCLTGPRYLETLQFHRHDSQMQDKVNSEKPLKPDVLGLLHPPPPDADSRIPWRDVALIVEVKRQVSDAIRQLATYARNHLTLDRRRSFSIAIHFNQRALALSFLCFHRSGLSASLPLYLKKEEGFRSIIKYMVGVLSIQDEASFGFDTTRVNDVYRLNDCNYEIERTIQLRESIRGHSTAVYALKLQPAGTQDHPASLKSRELTCVAPFPEKIIYKMSYQIKGRPSEGTFFSNFYGNFGVIDTVGFQVCPSDDRFGSTEYHVSNAIYLKLDNNSQVGIPEPRYLHCVAMALEGLPLLGFPDDAEVPRPAELLETVLHSIIGHYNMFLGGVLHRDISAGNIVRLQEPINRHLGRSMPLVHGMLSADVNLGKCRGFLIDGDHAINWREGPITQSLERSGTLPFMSMHLLIAWNSGDSALHTPADDLESFLWVLVWSLLRIFRPYINNPKSKMLSIDRALSSRNLTSILNKESLVKAVWMDQVFSDLIQEWLEISANYRKIIMRFEKTLRSQKNDINAANRTLDELDKYWGGVYREFIQAGYKHLKDVRAFPEWQDVVSFDKELNT